MLMQSEKRESASPPTQISMANGKNKENPKKIMAIGQYFS